ncbi:SET domain-containing protein SmydA-8-like [Bacillus rossius redtenbacheri]|uniref:SET domain-containing protein SmydA-8-like n=1 Tax=Bacillus rossius redtenbacheri TaxID=93214 RepID=UPI002FDD7900
MTHCTSHGTEKLTQQGHCAFTSRDSLKQVDVDHTEPLLATPANGDVKNSGIPHSPKAPAEQSGAASSSRETPVQEDVCGTDQFQVSPEREGVMNHCNSHRHEEPAEQSGAASHSRETPVQEDVFGTDQFQVSSGRGVMNHCNSHRHEAPAEQSGAASPVQEDVCCTERLLVAHLARSGFSQPAPRPWALARSGISGRGLVATRDLQAGDLVLVDGPLVLAPRASPRSPPLCAACHRGGVPLQACAAGCGLPLCARCDRSPAHRPECSALLAWRGGKVAGSWSPCLLWVLGAVRCLGLGAADREVLRCLLAHGGPTHAVELEILEKELNGGPGPTEPERDFMRLSCRVMDANAFETPQPPEEDEAGPPSPSLRGLYPVAAMMNHACSPNTMHVCGKGHRMVVRAAAAVRVGEELTNSYTTLLWGTLARRRHLLATKHFLCRCERCRHPQEWGARLSALACPRQLCGGCVMPSDPLQLSPAWRCDACDAQLSGRQAAAVQAALGRLLEHVDTSSPGDIRRFLADQAGALPACNQVAVQLKCDLICQYGHREGHLYTELSDSHLQHKETLCKEILHLLEILRTGQCNMKGLICYELACTLLEQRRRLSQGDGGAASQRRCETAGREARAALEQSALIFQGDATAPAGLWRLLDETSTADHLASPGL